MQNREVMVRTKTDLFKAVVVGWWEDRHGDGPVVQTENGGQHMVSVRRIVKFLDDDEVPMWDVDL